jgi:SAM-dependent methyltransferase
MIGMTTTSDTTSRWVNQFRKPAGWFGRFNLRTMNRRHSKLTDWGLAQVSIGTRATILDVGCGGGRTVQKLAALAPEGRVYGVDYSDASVALSRKTNKRGIQEGRVDIRQASASRLPFSDHMFDLVTAVETHFYWPDLLADVQEVLRVLKPGGTFLILAEAYKGGKYDKRLERFAAVMTQTGPYSHLTADQHRELLSSAGFFEAQVIENYDKGWICALGKKRT